MRGFFIELLNMSLSASFVALIVMLIRLPLRKAPKIYSYVLWAVVLFRLVCPFTFQLPVSAVPVQPQAIPHNIVYSESPSIQSGLPVVDQAVNTAIERSLPPASPSKSVNPIQIALEIGSYLWLAGFLALLIYGMTSYLHIKKRVMTAIRVHDNIYETDLIQTPFVLGLIRPKIYIPTGLGEQELEYVIEHERTHIKRFDYLIKPIAFLVACFHWFNPLVWISYALMARDMELSADESVMKRYDEDIRGRYSHSLLALSVKKSGLLSPLAFGETGVKKRVKNVLQYKKPAFWVSVVSVVLVAAVSLSLVVSKQREETPGSMPNQGATQTPSTDQTPANQTPSAEQSANSDSPTSTPEASNQTMYSSVSIEFLSEMIGFKATTGFSTTDPRTIAYIDTILKTSQTPTEEKDLNNYYTNQYAVKLANDHGGYSCKLYYDTLYDKAYLVKDGGLYETDTDFARYIDSFLENSHITLPIDNPDAVALFKSYGWTLDYRINAITSKLSDINVLSSFQPNAYYFAYNNELSKDIGLDMSEYSNTSDVRVEIYRIHERMPQEFNPIKDSRGIVLRKGGKIIGAYISAGRHSAFNAISLKGNRFEKVTGRTVNEWMADRVKADGMEERLAKLKPEQVIEEYFTALENKDAEMAGACISKKTLLENLTANMQNENLYNERVALPLTDSDPQSKSSFDNLKLAKLSKVEPIDERDNNGITYRVTVNLQYKNLLSVFSGEQSWDCSMVYESPQTGWKIVGFGH
ncbi:M56 family metallopeptidase [Gorillibacterium timonense]|uniref:M56 family metallopeptidase n=1 Tax=Gorillibacterium timonense TaxID=1689269 RepID=UPI00071E19FC|nr:M56 family metallopeptidase [Gorillibacterium timonense]